MFWGCVVSEKKPYTVVKDSDLQVVHLSNIALSKSSGTGKTYLLITRQKETFTLACLQKDKVECHSLDLYLRLDQGITLSVSGEGEIHVTGYLDMDVDMKSSSEDEGAFIEGSLNDKIKEAESEEEEDSDEDSDEEPKKKVEEKKVEKKKEEHKKDENNKPGKKKQEQKKPEQKKPDQKKKEEKPKAQDLGSDSSEGEFGDDLKDMIMGGNSDEEDLSDDKLKKIVTEKKREAGKPLLAPPTKKLKEEPKAQPQEGKKKKKKKKNKNKPQSN